MIIPNSIFQPTVNDSPVTKTTSWTESLNKLGEQVKQSCPAEPQSHEADEQPPSKSLSNKPREANATENGGRTDNAQRENSVSSNIPPIGNRRTRPEQRQFPVASASPLPAMSSWANYLDKLSEQVLSENKGENPQPNAPAEPQQASVVRHDDRTHTAQRENLPPSNEPAGLPIGNRRTHAEQRQATAVQPAAEYRPYWAVVLSWFWVHIRRQVRSRQLPGTEAHPPEADTAFHARISLGIWGYYFAVKLTLLWMNLIPFHPLENLLLAMLILFSSTSLYFYRIKNTLTLVAALTLLYYDTWLPPISSIVSQASSLSDFKFSYLVELTSRFISLPVIAVLLTVCLSYRIVSYRLRIGALVFSCLAALYLFEYPVPNMIAEPAYEQSTAVYQPKPDMDKVEKTFFDHEAQRSVWLPMPQADAVPFDVIFIHVCSLSWDDVRYVGLDQHPLWQRFDILLTKFNSAASYSGPAAIRLLRATCGQPSHTNMYLAANDNCYLMDNLRNSGFEANFAMNHTGRFDDFLGTVKAHGRLTAAPVTLNGLEVAQLAFDDAPVYDDLKVLDRWLETRKESASPRVALYYNTVSLHDGNHFPGAESLPNTLETYQGRLRTFLDEMEQFMQILEKSGRRAVVVMVPEHGGAVRGDARQIAGLREIPTPAITLVPVGIKVTGGHTQRKGETLLVDQATSYLAISHIVARMLENSPFTGNTYAPSDYVTDLPSTQFVAQSQSTTLIEDNSRLHLKHGSSSWEEYTDIR